MISFRCTRKDRTGTPVLYNSEIWEFAEEQIRDYRPALLKEPGKFNAFHFLESYLGANLEYQDIYYREGECPIAGATVFSDGYVRVFDRESQCIRPIFVPAGTILIDNATIARGNEGFAAFTALHEGGHFNLHSQVFSQNADQMGLFERSTQNPKSICCRHQTVEQVSSRYCRRFTPEWTRERQANVYAAFAAMPRPTFIPYAKDLIRNAGFKKGIFVDDPSSGWEGMYTLDKICDELAATYGVSRTAARVHLTELGLLMPKYKYDEMCARLYLF